MEEFKYKVYVKLDENNCIAVVESDLTLKDTTGYVQIDEGTGDKYAHAQGNYFPRDKPLRDSQGRGNYKYVNNEVVELTDEEKESLFPTQVQQPTEQQILNAKLLQDNANMQLELEQQKQLNAQILLQLAGGSTNA
ncbi:Conserved hypothetical protein [Clostridium neonatale]|uniref:hypothetical protein n=2 Tax=Clostridium neonatale TaxID=137838 RepID=UPI00291C2582|nr:hypothetical protein [Clostridium neonatale]CAI3579938.1 Conserved hypothetical protein [Clostridium neonatale]CAI3600845.1 Conserved hypothetical protein [Clostridium neonatale]CAI3652801.1 Conserved hypothetical protein [Clostridium neonatale]